MKKLTLTILFLFILFGTAFSQASYSEEDTPLNEESPSAYTENSVFSKSSSMGTIFVQTNVTNALVFLNGSYQGQSPVEIDNLVPGSYILNVKKDGYYPQTFTIYLDAGESKNIQINLQRVTGILSFQITQQNAEIFIDGSRVYSKIVQLPEGLHSVIIKAFGYLEIEKNIYVPGNFIRALKIDLAPAPFTVSNVHVYPKAFNPHNPGNLGLTEVSFIVSGPGKAIIKVSNENGEVLKTLPISPFTTWNQAVYWNGKTPTDTFYPNGRYTISMAFEGKDPNGTIVEIEKTVYTNIDDSIYYQLAQLSSSGISLGQVSSARVFPSKTLFTDIAVTPTFSPTNNSFEYCPIIFGIAVTPTSWLELSGRTGIWLGVENNIPLFIGATAKFANHKNNFYYGALIRYGYASEQLNKQNSETGLGIGGTVGMQASLWYFGTSADFVWGPKQGFLNKAEFQLTNGLAVQFQKNNISTNIWAKTYTTFGENINFTYNGTGMGINFSFFPPKTNFILQLATSAYLTNSIDLNLEITAGFTVLY